MANSKFYIPLPTPTPSTSRSGNRRPPLTPSVVSSPCITTHTSLASRRDSGCGSPEKATSLLAKVASHPATPKRGTPVSSPLPSPTLRSSELHASSMYSPEARRPEMSRRESARYWYEHKHQDGYVSFPDFEKFCSNQNTYDHEQRPQQAAVKT